MFGVSVYFWGVDDSHPLGFSKMFKNYLWSGGLGHAALKLVLPDSPLVEAWMRQYCCDPSNPIKSRIPFNKTSLMIRNQEGILEQVPCYEVYFSWWPRGLQGEIFDSISQIFHQPVSHQRSPEEETLIEPSGIIKRTLESLFPKWFETKVHWPIMYSQHMTPLYLKCKRQVEELEEKHSQLKDFEFTEMINPLADSNPDLEPSLKRAFVPYKEWKQLRLEKLKWETYGASPQHIIQLPLQSNGLAGLDPQKLLKEMHDFTTQYEFNVYHLNCSHAIRYILLAAVEQHESQLQAIMGRYSLCPAIIDNPSRVFNFSAQLQSSFIRIRSEQVLPSHSPKANHI